MARAHGTASSYFNGCQCDDCKAAGVRVRAEGTHEAYLAGKTRVKPLWVIGDNTTPFDPEDPRHGGLSAYTMGCRCPWCREVGTVYRAVRKQGGRLPKGFNVRNR